MPMHTTNYTNTFITVADDCPVDTAQRPPLKASGPSVANLQFDIISQHPYQYTSDDILFQVYAIRNEITAGEMTAAREQFFSKGQPCFRASPLTKRYGFGVHANEESKIAIYACESKEYQQLTDDTTLKVLKAMKTRR